MEDFLNNDALIGIAGFLAGALAAGIGMGAGALIASFRKSSNKLDDVLIPILEALKDAVDGLKNSTPAKKE